MKDLLIKSNVVERRDGIGFIEILPAGGCGWPAREDQVFKVHDELHTQRDYRALEALVQ